MCFVAQLVVRAFCCLCLGRYIDIPFIPSRKPSRPVPSQLSLFPFRVGVVYVQRLRCCGLLTCLNASSQHNMLS